MDWAQLLKDLRGRGWTQTLVAEHCGVSQSSISALASGDTQNPAFALGNALVELHRSEKKAPVSEKAA